MSDVIVKCQQFGNAVTSMPYKEQIFVADTDGVSTTQYIPRETMIVELGVKLYFAAGSDRNIKLTTRADLELFKAYLRTKDYMEGI